MFSSFIALKERWFTERNTKLLALVNEHARLLCLVGNAHRSRALRRRSGRRATSTEALKQTTRLHEDYHLELAESANAVLAALWQSGAAPLAREAGLPRQLGC